MSCPTPSSRTALEGYTSPTLKLSERAVGGVYEELGQTLAERLRACDHGYQGSPNSHHLEGDVLRHTAMVADRMAAILSRAAVPEPCGRALRRLAIAHDLGKPDVRTENAVDGKTRFFAHPAWSVFRMLDWLQGRAGGLTAAAQDPMFYPTLAAVALHDAALTELYSGNTGEKGKEKWARILAYNPDLRWLLPAINLADDLGRIAAIEQRETSSPIYADVLARTPRFPERPSFGGGSPLQEIVEKPTLVVMVGLPGSGKSTIARQIESLAGVENTYIASLDRCAQQLAQERGVTYADVQSDPLLIQEADKRFQESLAAQLTAKIPPRTIIIDKTHVGTKSRSRTLSQWNQILSRVTKSGRSSADYRCVAFHVLTPYNTCVVRCGNRASHPVGEAVIRNMVGRYAPPLYGECSQNWRHIPPWIWDGIVTGVTNPDTGQVQISAYEPDTAPAPWTARILDLMPSAV